MANKASHAAGRYAMDIEGKFAGFMKSCELPSIEGDVTEHNLATDNFVAKQIANFKYGACKIEIGLGMSGHLYDWIKAAMEKGATEKDCAIIVADFDYKAMNRVELFGCHITEISFPTHKGDAKDGYYITVGLQPATVRFADGDGAVIKGNLIPKQKQISTNNFKFQLGWGLPTARVSEVAPSKWEAKSAMDHIGEHNEFTQHYTKLTVGDLSFTVSGADAYAWQKFADNWFRGGQRRMSDETTASIEILGPDMKNHGTIEMEGVGLKKIAAEKVESNKEGLYKVKVDCYVEKMKAKYESD